MSDIEKVLKDVVYGGVGAVATAFEAGSELARTFVEKGHAAVRQGQEKAEELKQSIRDACMKDTGIDLNTLTRAQRDELLQQLQAMAEAEDAAAAKEVPTMETVEKETPAEKKTDAEEAEIKEEIDEENANG